MRLRSFSAICALALVGCGGGESFVVATEDASVGSDGSVADVSAEAAADTSADVKTDAPVTTDPCAGKADGTVCSTLLEGFLCIGGSCVTTRCGDGYVDSTAGEECDDANEVTGDGCSFCKFDCKAHADCDDGSVCSGVEQCDLAKHVCKAGTPAPVGSDCTLEGGAAGVCNGAKCARPGCGDGIVAEGEVCDDGNTVDGDGCDSDCTWSCESDKGCDDGDACNGVETCNPATHACEAGTPLACDDGKSCTVDSCHPEKGCLNEPIDEDGDGRSCEQDCDDSDPSVFVGAPELCDGKDNDCDGTKDEPPVVKAVCFTDVDGDGHSAAGDAIEACVCPPGTTVNPPVPVDCSDRHASVHPKQTAFFAFPYCATGTDAVCAETSFDYDCSGAVEKARTRVFSGSCPVLTLGACNGEGWKGSVPACGAEGVYVHCVKSGLTCKPSEVKVRQACH